jgi:hypothetical protein
MDDVAIPHITRFINWAAKVEGTVPNSQSF